MKTKIYGLLVLSLLLIGCNNNVSISESSSTSSSINNQSTSSISSTNDSSEKSISSSIIDEYYDNTIIECETIDIINNTIVNLESYISKKYEDSWIEIKIDDKQIAISDLALNIYGKKEGVTIAKIIADDKYDEVTINVMGQYLKKEMIENKSITVLGTSISDVGVKAEPYLKVDTHKFWIQQIEETYKPKAVYNHAHSGSTISYSKSMAMVGCGDYSGVNYINESKTKSDIKNSDIVFIEYGANDFFRKVSSGTIGDINDSNYKTVESYKGAYSYIIDKIQEYNPNALIVCLSILTSSWDFVGDYNNQNEYFKTRDDMSDFIKELAASKHCVYIDVSHLWDTSSTSLAKYCVDGIHPSTEGYALMVKKIFNLD